eukprot:m.347828 g.347828  ORF g.347828 m.347828 type:complete len:808 (-) comp34282_c0_seq1:54-2477(-)
MQNFSFCLGATLFLTLFPAMLFAYPLPPNIPKVIDVTTFGAKGDGVTDDTASIRAAISHARAFVKDPSSPYPCPHYGVRVLYFPKGEYLVTDTLQLYINVTVFPNGTVVPVYFFRISLELIVMGDGVDETTITLAQNSLGFQDVTKTKPLFRTFPGYHHNDGQWMGYQDMTLKIGAGNPGAVALDHISNNVGGLVNMRMTSDDKNSAIGLDFSRDLGGQAYFKNIFVDGFRTGINLGGALMTVALENITVAYANIGVNVTDKMAQIRVLSTDGSVALPIVTQGSASLVVIDSRLDTSGHIAIDNIKGTQLFVRNVTTSASVAVREPLNTTTPGPLVKEFSHHPPISAFSDAPKTSPFLNVQIPTAPTVPVVAKDAWEVFDISNCGKHNGTQILQAVIDSGVTHLFLNHTYGVVNDTSGCDVSQIILRKNIRHFHGGWGGLGTTLYKNTPPGFMAIRIDTMDHDDPVVIEGVQGVPGFLQNATNQLIFRQVLASHPAATLFENVWGKKTGDVWMESFQGGSGTVGGSNISHFGVGPCLNLNPGTNVWATALDFEGTQHHIRINGGSLFSLGTKLGEIQGLPSVFANGGRLELLGGVFNGGMSTGSPTVIVNNSDAALIGWTNRFFMGNASKNAAKDLVVETVLGVTHGLPEDAFPFRIARFHDPLMVNNSELGNHVAYYRSALQNPGPTPPQPPPPPPPPPSPPPPGPRPPPKPKGFGCNTTFGQCQHFNNTNGTQQECDATCQPVLTPKCEQAFEKVCPGLHNKGSNCTRCVEIPAHHQVLVASCPLMHGQLLGRIVKLYCGIMYII